MSQDTFFVLSRIAGTAILLAGLACLGWGGFRLADELWFLATSVRGRGEIVHVTEKHSMLVRSSRELQRRGAVPSVPFLAHAVAGELGRMRAIYPEKDWPSLVVFGVRLLSLAARAGSAPVVKALLDAGADVTIAYRLHPREPEGTALDEAVRAGHVEVVKQLARAWVEKHHDPAKLAAPVALAAEKGRWDLVRALVDAGASPNAPYSTSPLHRAAEAGNLEMVDYLLAHGAEPRAEADRRVLPIELARDGAVYAALVKAGGDPAFVVEAP